MIYNAINDVFWILPDPISHFSFNFFSFYMNRIQHFALYDFKRNAKTCANMRCTFFSLFTSSFLSIQPVHFILLCVKNFSLSLVHFFQAIFMHSIYLRGENRLPTKILFVKRVMYTNAILSNRWRKERAVCSSSQSMIFTEFSAHLSIALSHS